MIDDAVIEPIFTEHLLNGWPYEQDMLLTFKEISVF